MREQIRLYTQSQLANADQCKSAPARPPAPVSPRACLPARVRLPSLLSPPRCLPLCLSGCGSVAVSPVSRFMSRPSACSSDAPPRTRKPARTCKLEDRSSPWLSARAPPLTPRPRLPRLLCKGGVSSESARACSRTVRCTHADSVAGAVGRFLLATARPTRSVIRADPAGRDAPADWEAAREFPSRSSFRVDRVSESIPFPSRSSFRVDRGFQTQTRLDWARLRRRSLRLVRVAGREYRDRERERERGGRERREGERERERGREGGRVREREGERPLPPHRSLDSRTPLRRWLVNDSESTRNRLGIDSESTRE
jgi:hypothetical protein